jgi:hypothetical protein
MKITNTVEALNVITLGQQESYKVNQMITIGNLLLTQIT